MIDKICCLAFITSPSIMYSDALCFGHEISSFRYIISPPVSYPSLSERRYSNNFLLMQRLNTLDISRTDSQHVYTHINGHVHTPIIGYGRIGIWG